MIYIVEVEIKIEADSPEEASERVMYGLISHRYPVIDYGITCTPYEEG